MSVNDKIVIKNMRARKLTVKVPTNVLEPILKSAMDLALINNDIAKFKDQPELEDLRKVLDPGYVSIGAILSMVLDKPIVIKDLAGMTVDILPTAGYCLVSVSYYEEDKKYNYNIVIHPQYGSTYINRIMRMPVVSETDRDKLIRDFYRKL